MTPFTRAYWVMKIVGFYCFEDWSMQQVGKDNNNCGSAVISDIAQSCITFARKIYDNFTSLLVQKLIERHCSFNLLKLFKFINIRNQFASDPDRLVVK